MEPVTVAPMPITRTMTTSNLPIRESFEDKEVRLLEDLVRAHSRLESMDEEAQERIEEYLMARFSVGFCRRVDNEQEEPPE